MKTIEREKLLKGGEVIMSEKLSSNGGEVVLEVRSEAINAAKLSRWIRIRFVEHGSSSNEFTKEDDVVEVSSCNETENDGVHTIETFNESIGGDDAIEAISDAIEA
ncbi:hypothetical protein TB2_021303 [Malus domestica]